MIPYGDYPDLTKVRRVLVVKLLGSGINVRCMCGLRAGFKHWIAPRRRALQTSRPD